MSKFKEKNLIINLNKKIYQLDELEDLIILVLGQDYLNLSEIEKFTKRYTSLLPFSIENKYLLIDSRRGIIKSENIFENQRTYSIVNSLFIDDEIVYFLSLCKINQIQILEKVGANIFANNIKINEIKSNYILINHFADKLLKDYLKNNKIID